MKSHTPITSENISHYRDQQWITNAGNFQGGCPICKKPSKKGDLLLLEWNVSNGLSSNEYCSVCGNIRLQELTDYYDGMRRETK